MREYRDIPKNRTVSFSGDVAPDETRRRDLGLPDKEWRTVYARQIVAQSVTVELPIADADTVDGFHASSSPTASYLLALDGSSQFPTSVYPSAVLVDGTRPLAADWDVGAFKVTAQQLESDIASGTTPLIITSTTLVPNLNADLLDSYEAAAFPRKAEAATVSGAWTFNANIGMGVGITIDGVDVSDHSARHDPGGADAITTVAPGLTFSTSNAEGSAGSLLRTDATITLFDVTNPITIDVGDAGATGSAGVAARRDHEHGITTSDDPGAAAAILASDASGFLTLVKLSTDTISDKSGGSLIISPTGDVVFDPAGDDILPNISYDLNIGGVQKKFLTIHVAELWASSLVAQEKITTIGGHILIGPTTVLTSDLTDSATTIYVKHNQMSSGDTAYLESSGKVEFISIDSAPGGSGPYTYTVTRDLDGTGGNAWDAGDAAFNTGAVGDGFIDLYSVRGAGRFLADDETGAAWGPPYHGLRLDSTAFIETYNVDLSPYAGTEGSDTDYIIILKDSAGKEAWGYIGAAGSGRTYGINLLSNGGFETFTGTADDGITDDFDSWAEVDAGSGDIVEASTTAHTGSYACKLTYGNDGCRVRQGATVTPGTLYLLQVQTRGDGSVGGRVYVYDVTNSSTVIDLTDTGVTGTSYTWKGWYFTAPAGCVSVNWSLYSSASSGACYFDQVGIFAVNEPFVTGVHIVSDLNGSAREWADIESGFDYNGSVYTFDVRGARGGAGPTIVGNVRASATYNDWVENWAIGNLNGLYGYGADTYGAGFGKYSEADYLTIDSSNGVRFLDSADTVQGQLSSGAWVLGEVGAGKSNVQITEGAVGIRSNATNRVSLTSAGVLSINDSGGAAVFSFDASAGAEFAKPLSIGTSGGIWQGSSGTFASPNTGMKIYNVSSDGVIKFYTSGLDSVTLDAGGISMFEIGTIEFLGTGPASKIADLTADFEYSTWYDLVTLKAGYSGRGWLQLVGYYDSTHQAVVDIRSSEFDSDYGEVNVDIDGTINMLHINRFGAFINEATNAKQALGLTINQGANADEILAFKSSDVAHGITDYAETDTYGTCTKVDGDTGGLLVTGYNEDERGLVLAGRAVTDDTGKSTSANAYVQIYAQKKSGTAVTAPGADANLLAITSYGNTRFVFDQEGEMHCDGPIGAGDDWDDWDDLALASDLSRLPKAKWDEMMRYGAEDFERAGLLTLSTDEDGNRHAFIKVKAMLQFSMCCFREVYDRMKVYEDALLEMGATPQLLNNH